MYANEAFMYEIGSLVALINKSLKVRVTCFVVLLVPKRKLMLLYQTQFTRFLHCLPKYPYRQTEIPTVCKICRQSLGRQLGASQRFSTGVATLPFPRAISYLRIACLLSPLAMPLWSEASMQ